MSPSVTTSPSSDRLVDQLENLPLPPHHSAKSAATLLRSDSDVSQTSTSGSVPRSSSFTRSKRFLTGEGLTAREALGIIDNDNRSGPYIDQNPLLESFDVAREAMNRVFGYAHNQGVCRTPPPPPKLDRVSTPGDRYIPKPPPLPGVPLLSGLVFGDDIVEVEEVEVGEEDIGRVSPKPQSPDSIAPQKPEGRDEEEEEEEKEEEVNVVNSSGEAKVEEEKEGDTSGVGVSPRPRGKTISRLLGVFSPRNLGNELGDRKELDAEGGSGRRKSVKRMVDRSAKPETGVESTEKGSTSTARRLHGDYCEEHDDDSPLSSLADLMVRERPIESRDDDSNTFAREIIAGEHTATKPNFEGETNKADSLKIGNAQHQQQKQFGGDSGKKTECNDEKKINIETGARANSVVGTLVDNEAELVKERGRKRQEIYRRFQAIQDRLRQDSSSGNKVTASEAQQQVKDHSLCDRSGKLTVTFPRPQQTTVSQSAESSVSYASAKEEFSPPRKASSGKKIDAEENHSDKLKTPPKENTNLPKSDRSPKSSDASPTLESMTSSSSYSKADRYCDHPGVIPQNAGDSYQLRGMGPVNFPSLDQSGYGGQYSIPMFNSDRSGVNAMGFLDGPQRQPNVEDTSEGHRFRRDSHAAFLKTYSEHVKTSRREERKDGRGMNESGDEDVGIRKTKSGLRERVVAVAKKLPRGRSFPRLRSWGDMHGRKEEKEFGWPRGQGRTSAKDRKNEDRNVEGSAVKRAGSKRFGDRKKSNGVVGDKSSERPGELFGDSVGRVGLKVSRLERKQAHEEMLKMTKEMGETGGIATDMRRAKSADVGDRAEGNRAVLGDKKIGQREDRLEGGVRMDVKKNRLSMRRGKSDGSVNLKKTKMEKKEGIGHDIETGVGDGNASKKETEMGSEESEEAGIWNEKLGRSRGERKKEEKKAEEKEAEEKKAGTVELKAKEETEKKEEVAKNSVNDSDRKVEEKKPGLVTIERVIRRTRADGSVETVRKKIRVRPEKVFENGDVLVKRTVERMKDDGSGGMERLTVMQVIPRRKKANSGCEKKDESEKASGSMPELSQMKEGNGDERGVGSGWGRMWSFQGRDKRTKVEEER